MAVSTAARYVRGEWTALVTENGTALLHPLIDEDRVRGVWDALREGTGVSGCLEVLATDGLTGLPDFALVQHGDGEFRVLVRGEATITAGDSTVGAAGIATWREALIPAQSYRVAITDDRTAGPAWPVSTGIVLASEMEWEMPAEGFADAAHAYPAQTGDSPGDEAADSGDSNAQSSAAELATGVGDLNRDEAGAVRSADEGGAVEEPHVAGGMHQPEEEPAAELEDEPSEGDAAEEHAVDEPVAESIAGADEDVDGASEAAPDTSAAEPDSVGTDGASDSDEPGQDSPPEQIIEVATEAQQPEPGAAEEPVEATEAVGGSVAAAPSLHAGGDAIIDSLPWAASAADRQEAASQAQAEGPEPESESVPRATAGGEAPQPLSDSQAAQGSGWDEDLPEHTVLSSHGPNAAAQAAGATGSAPVPPWQAPAGMSMPSGPVAPYGQGDLDIDGDHDGQTVMVSELPKDHDMTIAPGLGDTDLYDEPGQPSAGSDGLALSVSTGAELLLDRPVLIGRAPESARFSAGVQPRLVTVPSPEQDISRTHVEVRAEGAGAVVTDLNSTNGTVIIQPDSAPRRLHAGEGASVPVGTLIDLGDGVTAKVHAADQGVG